MPIDLNLLNKASRDPIKILISKFSIELAKAIISRHTGIDINDPKLKYIHTLKGNKINIFENVFQEIVKHKEGLYFLHPKTIKFEGEYYYDLSECVIGYLPYNIIANTTSFNIITTTKGNIIYSLEDSSVIKNNYLQNGDVYTAVISINREETKSINKQDTSYNTLQTDSDNTKLPTVDIDNYNIKTTSDTSNLDTENRSYNDLTAKEYACIHLKLPNSGTKWLDDLINLTQNKT